MSRRPARGQATVELALGALLFVTIITVGVYLSETAYLSLKVSEAANFATWYGTGLRVTHFDVNSATNPNTAYSPWGSLVSTVQSQAQSRYVNYDGLSQTRGPPGIDQALSQADAVTVSCRKDPNLGFRLLPRRAPSDGAYPAQVSGLLQQYYEDKGAMLCTASSDVAAVRVPTHVLDQHDGFFHVTNWTNAPIHVCGAGRAEDGQCKGEYAVVLGDWSLDGAPHDPVNNSYRAQAQPRDNQPFRAMVSRLFDEDGQSRGHAASTFAAQLSVRSTNYRLAPYQDDQFLSSYAGYEHGYWDWTTTGDYVSDTAGQGTGNAGALFSQPNLARGNCFLGRADCPEPISFMGW